VIDYQDEYGKYQYFMKTTDVVVRNKPAGLVVHPDGKKTSKKDKV
jgi:hypothetical protein